jgi:DNA-directed RNA polymerase specialized sigma24 family protein
MFRLFRRSHARGEYGAPTQSPVVNAQRAMLVERSVAGLPALPRDVLRGWYVYGLSPARIARRLSIQRETLVEELHRARVMVRNLLASADRSRP